MGDSAEREEKGRAGDGAVRTDGAAVVGGDVTVGEGGVFAGRDHVVYNVRADVGLYTFQSPAALDRFTHGERGPYKYLGTYQTEDAAIFFGREAAIEQMCRRMRQQEHTVLCGAPGMGKSSLINAGLMPILLRQGWLVLRVAGYGYPTAMLRLALDVEQLHAPAAETPALTDLLRHAIETTGQPVTVFFDQFERFLLNLPAAERDRFVQEFTVCRSLDWHGRLRFVFALRTDFLAELGGAFQDDVPHMLDGAYVLQPMTRDEARRAIVEPLVGRPVRIDRDFVDQVLLAHLDEQDQQRDTIYPPHLQIVCQTLYEAALAQHAPIDEQLYRSLGRAERILGDYLEVELLKLKLAERAAMRAAIKEMVSAHGTRVFRSAAELAAVVGQDIESLLQKLVTARLLEVQEEDGVLRFSLSHEVMVPEVQSWFSEPEWTRRRARELLDRAWADWGATGRLLVEPQRLAWLRRMQPVLELTPDQMCLLLRSAVAFEREPSYWVGQMAADGPARQVLERLVAGEVDGPVARRALQAVGAVADDERPAATLPRAAVEHPDRQVRVTAALAMAALGEDEALRALRPHLRGTFQARWRGLAALAHMRAAGVSTPWPSLLSIPVQALMTGWVRLWAGRGRTAALAVGAAVGGALAMGLQSLLAIALGLPGWQGIAFTFPTVGALLGGLSGALLAAFQHLLPPRSGPLSCARDILTLTAAFTLAGMVLLPLIADIQPLWSSVAAGVLTGLGMALPLAWSRPGQGRGPGAALLAGAGAALGAALARAAGALLAADGGLRLYLFPALNADTVSIALRQWPWIGEVNPSLLAIPLQALTGLLLGLGIVGGLLAAGRIWQRAREEEGDA